MVLIFDPDWDTDRQTIDIQNLSYDTPSMNVTNYDAFPAIRIFHLNQDNFD
jgi:hypothetical protein